MAEMFSLPRIFFCYCGGGVGWGVKAGSSATAESNGQAYLKLGLPALGLLCHQHSGFNQCFGS